MKKIRVLLVDDSAFIRRILKDMLETDPQIQVVDTAKNGKEALEKLKSIEVDVVTLDVEMPLMNGIEVLKEIMQTSPFPVVMISSYTKSGEDLTLQALSIGAVDFITKPSNLFKMNSKEIQDSVVEKVKTAAYVKVRTHFSQTSSNKMVVASNAALQKETITVVNKQDKVFQNTKVKNIITIGTSTGGPRALQAVVSNISEKVNAPVVIVQHMPPGFTKSLAERLNQMSRISVKEAEDGEYLKNNTAYIAPGDRHLLFEQVRDEIKISLDNGPNVSGHKPSVDAMYSSVAKLKVNNIVAVIMTGMGQDGAKGIKQLKEERNAITIAEDESTCIVFGMPKSAIATGKVDKVVPLDRISAEINKLMEGINNA